jgi:UDP-N-acetylglucosamine--N-acetylmuramyl-(pentapeptide) pyrophosphoryl-undecaprenol N-acetylglucosamine transferase
LIPFPHAAANHQRINAKYLVEMGACIYLEDKELEPNKLRETINLLLDNPVKMNYLKQNSSHLAKFDAIEKITGTHCL